MLANTLTSAKPQVEICLTPARSFRDECFMERSPPSLGRTGDIWYIMVAYLNVASCVLSVLCKSSRYAEDRLWLLAACAGFALRSEDVR